MEDFYSVVRRHIVEAISADLDSFGLLRLHHKVIKATSAGSLPTISSVLSKLP